MMRTSSNSSSQESDTKMSRQEWETYIAEWAGLLRKSKNIVVAIHVHNADLFLRYLELTGQMKRVELNGFGISAGVSLLQSPDVPVGTLRGFNSDGDMITELSWPERNIKLWLPTK